MATTSVIILMIYVVLSLGGSLAPSPNYRAYPGASMERSKGREVPSIEMPTPKCSYGETFCEYAQSYPSEDIRKALRVNNTFSTFFKRARPSLELQKEMADLSRQGGFAYDPNEEPVCDVQELVIRPKVATNKNGEKKFIVNDGNEYRQFVKIEKCRKMDSDCSKISGTLPKNYSSRCVQKFSTSLMVAFDENYVDPYTEEFLFPTACVCYIKSPLISKR